MHMAVYAVKLNTFRLIRFDSLHSVQFAMLCRSLLINCMFKLTFSKTLFQELNTISYMRLIYVILFAEVISRRH